MGIARFLAQVLTVEARREHPLVDLKLFRIPVFSSSALAAAVSLFAVVGTMFLLSVFLGSEQHLSPLQIAWRLLVVTGVPVLVNPIVGRLMGRIPPIALLAGGLLLGAVGLCTMTGVGVNTGFLDISWRLAIFGVSMSMMLTTISVTAISAVPHQMAGSAAAVNTAFRQYGSALGPAILGVILSSRMSHGASMASGMHTALVVAAVVLVVAALLCLFSITITRTNHE